MAEKVKNKFCIKCGKEEIQGHGLCKTCHHVEWRAKNHDKVRANRTRYYENNRDKVLTRNKWSRVKSIYGITQDEYNVLYDAQGGCCAICGDHQIDLNRPLHIDHNHETGKIRGLLCNKCNFILGLSNENKEILQNCIAYLEKHDAPQ